MAQETLPDGVTRIRKDRGHVEYKHDQRGVRGYKELRVGRLTYEYEFDFEQFLVNRDFEVEWVDGPVRFRLEREEKGPDLKLWAYPSGRVEGHSTGGSHGSGGSTWDSVLVRDPREKYWYDEDEHEPTTSVSFKVTLRRNPFDLERTTSDDVQRAGTVASVGTVFSLVAKGSDHRMVEDDYRLTPDMALSQAKSLLRDAAEKPLHELRHNSPEEVIEHYRNAPGVQKHRKQATKKLAEVKWRLGRTEKPTHVERREREEERRQLMAEQESLQQTPPRTGVGKPDETDNRCPGCEGRFHKGDLVEESVNEDNGTLTGVEFRCPDCDTVVGSNVDYNGPVPVETPTGTELH